MATGKIQLKGKTLKLLEDYFKSPDTYNVADGCQFDEAFDAALEPVFYLFREHMVRNEVYLLAYTTITEAEDQIGSADELKDLSDDQVRSAIVGALECKFSRFPRDYEIRISLPLFTGVAPSILQICEGMLIDFNALTGRASVAQLVIRLSGSCGTNIDNPHLANCFLRIKVLMFLLESQGLLYVMHSPGAVAASCHDLEDRTDFSLPLPAEIERAVGGSKLRLRAIISPGETNSANDVVTNLREKLQHIGQTLDAIFAKGHETIATAIEWYSDSRQVANQTVALLEVCIGMEAILGDEEDIKDMTNRLCDRLAFSLGRTRQERTALAKDYRKVLTVRGKLVHGKQARLDDNDAAVLVTGRSLLRRVIDNELMHIKQ